MYGFLSGSLALLADAGHNLADVLGLVIAWSAVWLSSHSATATFTYRFRRSSIMASMINAIFVLVSAGMIAWEAIERLATPQPVAAATVLIVASAGIVVNGVTAWLFARGDNGDINIREVFVHMLADAAISAGVVLAALATLGTRWRWIDPIASLAIVAVIIAGTWGLFRESLRLSLDAVPQRIDQAEVAAYLSKLPGVTQIHHLHIWSMSTTEIALTAHLVRPAAMIDDIFSTSVAHALEHRFGIAHATIQIEATPNDHGCGCARSWRFADRSSPVHDSHGQHVHSH
ncbi:cobalt-zinc-cadmium efflux system protein [Sphingobium sp. OAS761]|nr:cobalt-zinc-cadmium efflux system protein [Sphingobium sp. OAS761]